MGDIKIAHGLLESMRAPGAAPEHRVIVAYRRDVSLASRPAVGRAALRQLTLIPATALSLNLDQVRQLAADPTVERIWPDLVVRTCLNASVPHIRAPEVWTAGYSGRQVPVGIVDTGIDAGHPDFVGRIAAMYDVTGEGSKDNHGHGTHVAGIVGGAGSLYRGVAPDCALHVAKVLHADGSGYMSEVIAGLEWVVEQGVKVVNLSLGGVGPCDGSDALSVACDAAVDRGIVVCVAAGNYGPQAASVGPPGCARKVLTVGASSVVDAVPSFSARGPTSDGRIKPDILMPGVDVVSCRATDTSMGAPLDTLYTRASGTSMAAPHAAGVAALLLEAFPGLTPAQVKDRMMTTSCDLSLDPNTQGKGRGDAYHAYLGTPSGPPVTPPASGCLTAVANWFVVAATAFRRGG